MAIVIRCLVVNLDTNEVMTKEPVTLKEARSLCVELAAKGGKYQAFNSVGGVFKSVTSVVEIDE